MSRKTESAKASLRAKVQAEARAARRAELGRPLTKEDVKVLTPKSAPGLAQVVVQDGKNKIYANIRSIPLAELANSNTLCGQFKVIATGQKVQMWFEGDYGILVLRKEDEDARRFSGYKAAQALSEISWNLNEGFYQWVVRVDTQLDKARELARRYDFPV